MINDAVLLEKLKHYDNITIAELIDKNINGRNAERNRKIIKRRLIDGIYYSPLSEEFNLSIRQTQNIIYAGVKRLISIV